MDKTIEKLFKNKNRYSRFQKRRNSTFKPRGEK